MLIVPYSNSFKKTHQEVKIKLPPVLKDKKIKEIRIIPKQHSRYFEIQYTYEVKEVQRELNENNVLGIDLGIDNLCTCVTNTGVSFIIDFNFLPSIMNEVPLFVTQVQRLSIPKSIPSALFLFNSL